MARVLCKELYMIAVAIPLLLVWWYSHGEVGNFLHEIGTSVALIGIMLLSFQIVLAGRFRWLDRIFGLDVLIRYHRRVALVAALLLLSHPLFLVAGGGGMALLISLQLPWYIWVGKATLFVLLLNIFLSIYQAKLKLSFEQWRLVHDGAALLIILFAFVHSGFTGHDIKNIPLLQVLWVVIPILFLLLYVYHLVIKPSFLHRCPYQVIEVKKETEKVYTLKFVPDLSRKIDSYIPGQFQFITLYRKDLPVEEHHWTISSSPTEMNFISSTIKELGDFTRTIGQTKPGDTATIDGPYGHFSYLLFPDEKDLVFIAGGIGITPLMAMLRYMRDTKSSIPVLLIYASEQEILFHDELTKMENEQSFPLRVIHVLSHPQATWKGESDHITKEMIERLVGKSLKVKSFYLSGPKRLVEGSVKALQSLDITKNQIHVEYFSFLD